MPLADTLEVTPARQAKRILAAWAAGDGPLLREELQKSQQLTCATGHGLDEERLELLLAVSQGLLRSPDPLLGGREDPALRRCLDLLAHLAQAAPATPVQPKRKTNRTDLSG